jgi:hypothetical protein
MWWFCRLKQCWLVDVKWTKGLRARLKDDGVRRALGYRQREQGINTEHKEDRGQFMQNEGVESCDIWARNIKEGA